MTTSRNFSFGSQRPRPELLCVLDGLWQVPWAGWACDSYAHWTVELVGNRWDDRARVIEWIDRKVMQWREPDAASQDRRSAFHCADIGAITTVLCSKTCGSTPTGFLNVESDWLRCAAPSRTSSRLVVGRALVGSARI